MKKYLITLLISISLILLSACNLFGNDDNNELESYSSDINNFDKLNEEKTNEADSEFYFDGSYLVTDGYSIKITNHEIVQSEEQSKEEPVIKFSYDVTVDHNETDMRLTAYKAWIYSFDAIQDNDPDIINKLDVDILASDNKSSEEVIKPGGTVSSSISYKLTDDETPVELIAKENMSTEEVLGSHEYSIE